MNVYGLESANRTIHIFFQLPPHQHEPQEIWSSVYAVGCCLLDSPARLFGYAAESRPADIPDLAMNTLGHFSEKHRVAIVPPLNATPPFPANPIIPGICVEG